MSKIRVSLLLSAVVISTSGCDQAFEQSYESLAEMRGKDVFSIVTAIHLPPDAQAIRVKFHADSDRYYISYVTADAAYSIKRSGLVPVGQANRRDVLKSVRFGVAIPKSADVYVGCRNAYIVPSKGGAGPAEVLLMANAEGRQYQWNLLHRADLMGRLCGSWP